MKCAAGRDRTAELHGPRRRDAALPHPQPAPSPTQLFSSTSCCWTLEKRRASEWATGSGIDTEPVDEPAGPPLDARLVRRITSRTIGASCTRPSPATAAGAPNRRATYRQGGERPLDDCPRDRAVGQSSIRAALQEIASQRHQSNGQLQPSTPTPHWADELARRHRSDGCRPAPVPHRRLLLRAFRRLSQPANPYTWSRY